MNSVEITISREPLRHLIYHFVLPYSNWEHVEIAYSENCEALSEGLQNAIWTLGAVPLVHRTDNLSAATHELIRTRGRGFTERYVELLSHYGMKPPKNRPGNAHELGESNRPLMISPSQSTHRPSGTLPLERYLQRSSWNPYIA